MRSPARRQVGTTHAEMCIDVVTMDVNMWELKERNSRESNTLAVLKHRENNTLAVLSTVDAVSGMHIESSVPNPTSSMLWKAFAHGWLRWTGAPKFFRVDLHRSQISREVFGQAEERGIFVDPTLAEAHWHKEPFENHAR